MTLVPLGAPTEHAGEHPDMMVDEHRRMLWPHYVNLMLGLWLLTSPLTLGYLSDFVPDANQLRVMAERGLPSFELRNLAMTWSDILSGVILPLGIVSIYFIIIQPIVIGTWCTLCLIAALAMAVMITYSLDEFVAMGQFLVWARRKGKPFWRTFWMGDAMEGGSDDTSKGLLGTTRERLREGVRGVTFPVTLLLSVAIGVWLTFTRLIFGSSGDMADSDHLVGALVVAFSIMAFAEVGRAVRFINIPFGAWLILAPWVLEGVASPLAVWNGVVCGALLILLAIPRGPVEHSYAGWDRYIV